MIALSVSDAEAVALLGGSRSSDPDLEAVAGILAATRDLAQPEPDADFSHLIAAAARESRVTPIERFANDHVALLKDRRPQLIQRVAMASAALLVFVAMSSGMAYAADDAKPGDLLYGLDQALETVGVGSGGATERLAEVEALLAVGAISEALQHVSQVLDGVSTSDEAKAALTAALARINGTGGGDLQIAAQVGELIAYLKTAITSDAGVNGQTVTDMIREINAPPVQPVPPVQPAQPVQPVPPIESPRGSEPPNSTLGQPDHGGPTS